MPNTPYGIFTWRQGDRVAVSVDEAVTELRTNKQHHQFLALDSE